MDFEIPPHPTLRCRAPRQVNQVKAMPASSLKIKMCVTSRKNFHSLPPVHPLPSNSVSSKYLRHTHTGCNKHKSLPTYPLAFLQTLQFRLKTWVFIALPCANQQCVALCAMFQARQKQAAYLPIATWSLGSKELVLRSISSLRSCKWREKKPCLVLFFEKSNTRLWNSQTGFEQPSCGAGETEKKVNLLFLLA